eukprot:gene36704-47845_t
MLKLGIGNSVRKAARFMKFYDGAQQYFNKTKELEIQFSMTPNFKLIEEMMDLMRTLFDAANDKSYNDVVQYIRNFLQRADVVALLDANVRCPPSSSACCSSSTTTGPGPGIDVASELESIQAVMHDCPSLDEDSNSCPHANTKGGGGGSSSGSGEGGEGGRGGGGGDVGGDVDEDDITMQLSNMLNEMNQ